MSDELPDFDSREHVERRERIAAEREFAQATGEHLDRLQRALSLAQDALTCAQLDYGPVQHGPSVNQPLADYMRELDHAERALSNARNALRALEAERRAAAQEHRP
jgi:hypothetical protein